MKNNPSRKKRSGARRGSRRKAVNLSALSASKPRKLAASMHAMKISDFYRPLKKPVTLRLDADVIAWFKKDGRRYQTRINSALRKVMEREMKA
jgi:uncharacterized protein (DUF4415 family)